MYTMQKCW